MLVTHTKGFYKKDTVIGEKDAPLDRMYVIAAGMGALQWQVSRFCSLARACRGVSGLWDPVCVGAMPGLLAGCP